MKIKVSIFNRRLFANYLAVLSVISLLTSFGLIAFQLPDDFSIRVVAGIIILALLVIVFLVMWVRANLEKSASLSFNNSTVEIRVGDIFNESGLKAIPFNEFFDTQVDERIIASTTLNGIFLKKMQDRTEEIESAIENINKTPIEGFL